MSRKWKTLILIGASLTMVTCVTTVILNAGASPESPLKTNQTPAQARTERTSRNLSLQPEAFRMSRRLGVRFSAKAHGTTTTTGTLVVGTSQQSATIIRRQADEGETVDVVLGGRTLTWRNAEGVRGVPSAPTTAERTMVEQLIFDSPDQFVLAQLRGAAYYAVARNVRADVGGSDSYTGPLWDLIRVQEPGTEESAQPLSTARVYYINVKTGLIDKIVSEYGGASIEASLLEWVDQAGEKVPSHIIWKRGDETIQEFRLVNLAVQQQQP
ncbi:MAG TPA: hypothetical protein VFP47_05590 [Pyrinomonadaceae bacterium]|nr:hypothetical protein [Pyrinomonadaceae bacterium]